MSLSRPFLPINVAQAIRIVCEAQTASISLLQRRLRIGYKAACAVMNDLIAYGIVRPSHGRTFQIDPHYFTRHPRKTMLDQRSLYVDRVVETALFFFECSEENNNGHTGVMDVIKPAPVENMELRAQVLGKSFRTRGLGLTEAALDLHDWLSQKSLVPPGCENTQQAISTACAAFERSKKTVTDEVRKKYRSFRRLARYYWLIHKHGTGVSNNSRVPDYFVTSPWLHMGESFAFAESKIGKPHPEHVVPFAFILRTCVELYSQEWSIKEVTWMLQRLLAIVYLTQGERAKLDIGTDNLLSSMPAD